MRPLKTLAAIFEYLRRGGKAAFLMFIEPSQRTAIRFRVRIGNNPFRLGGSISRWKSDRGAPRSGQHACNFGDTRAAARMRYVFERVKRHDGIKRARPERQVPHIRDNR